MKVAMLETFEEMHRSQFLLECLAGELAEMGAIRTPDL